MKSKGGKTVVDGMVESGVVPKSAVKKGGFKSDWREKNPGLHLLYVKRACKHLAMVRRMIQELMNESNTNVLDAAYVLNQWCEKQIKDDAAYVEADEILNVVNRALNPTDPDNDSD